MIIIGVLVSFSDRKVPVVTALITINGVETAKSWKYPVAWLATSPWAPIQRRIVSGNKAIGMAVLMPRRAAATCPAAAVAETSSISFCPKARATKTPVPVPISE